MSFGSPPSAPRQAPAPPKQPSPKPDKSVTLAIEAQRKSRRSRDSLRIDDPFINEDEGDMGLKI